jgi:hypothetical protein
MVIIDKIKQPASKWVPPPPKPVFRTTLEKQKYWEKEKLRWREGYGDGEAHICGMHFFHLSQGWIKDGSSGELMRPKYRDLDEWIINPIHDAFWGLQNHVGVVKRREVGLTVIGAGMLPSYSMRMFPGSTFGMTSCDQSRIFKAYSDKTDVYVKRLDGDIRPVFDRTVGYKENATKNQVYLRLPWYVNGPDGTAGFEYSDLYAKETADTDEAAKGFSGTRLRGMFIDEYPLHKRKAKLLNSSQACFMKGAEQSGFLLWGGTVEADITPEQINELQKLVRQSELLKFNVIFAPAWWGLFLDKNGISDKDKGVQWVMQERERLDKLEDKTYLRAFIKNYPLTLDEIFELGGSSRFDEYAVQAINDQKKAIDAKMESIPLYSVKSSAGVTKAVPTNVGGTFVLEHPKPNVDYIFGYDGIATSKLTSSDNNNSKLALVGMKGIDPQSDLQFAPVLKYSERPKSIEDANKNVLEIMKYYNQFGRAKIMGEVNGAGEHMIKMLMNAGMKSCIMVRKDLTKKGNVDTNKFWFYRNDKILDWQNETLNIYYKNYAGMVWFRSLLEDAGLADDDNKDEEDALKACLYGWGTGDLYGEPVKEKKLKKVMIIVGYENGTPIWEERLL